MNQRNESYSIDLFNQKYAITPVSHVLMLVGDQHISVHAPLSTSTSSCTSPIMTTAIYTPCHSPQSSQDFLSFHTCLQDMHDSSFSYPLSPTHRPSATPSRPQPLMFTPSPLRRRRDVDFDLDSSMQLDFEGFSAATGVSTPCHQRRSKKVAPPPRRSPSKQDDDLPVFFRPPNPVEEDEGSFLRSNAGHTSLPLCSPERSTVDVVRAPFSVAKVNFPQAPKRKVRYSELTMAYL